MLNPPVVTDLVRTGIPLPDWLFELIYLSILILFIFSITARISFTKCLVLSLLIITFKYVFYFSVCISNWVGKIRSLAPKKDLDRFSWFYKSTLWDPAVSIIFCALLFTDESGSEYFRTSCSVWFWVIGKFRLLVFRLGGLKSGFCISSSWLLYATVFYPPSWSIDSYWRIIPVVDYWIYICYC